MVSRLGQARRAPGRPLIEIRANSRAGMFGPRAFCGRDEGAMAPATFVSLTNCRLMLMLNGVVLGDPKSITWKEGLRACSHKTRKQAFRRSPVPSVAESHRSSSRALQLELVTLVRNAATASCSSAGIRRSIQTSRCWMKIPKSARLSVSTEGPAARTPTLRTSAKHGEPPGSGPRAFAPPCNFHRAQVYLRLPESSHDCACWMGRRFPRFNLGCSTIVL